MQKNHARSPGVACILAAGNQISVTVRDVLQQLVVNNNACIVKLNPVNDWIGGDLQSFLQPLIDAGVLRLVYGATATAQVRPQTNAVPTAYVQLSLSTACARGCDSSGQQGCGCSQTHFLLHFVTVFFRCQCVATCAVGQGQKPLQRVPGGSLVV